MEYKEKGWYIKCTQENQKELEEYFKKYIYSAYSYYPGETLYGIRDNGSHFGYFHNSSNNTYAKEIMSTCKEIFIETLTSSFNSNYPIF